MESRRDTAISLGLALLLHAALVASLFVGFRFASPQRPVYVPGPIIQAALVDFEPSASQREDEQAQQRAEAQRVEQQRQQQVRREQQQREAAQQQQREVQERQQREQQREQERQAELQRLAEQRAQQLAESTQAEQQRLEEARRREAEQQRQLEDVRRQREAAERERRVEAERLAQMEDQRRRESAAREQTERAAAAAQASRDAERAQRAGQEGEMASLRMQYAAAIRALVEANWLRPPTARAGLQCRVRVTQIPGGEVIAVNVIPNRCNADESTQRSIEQAVMRAQPLPYRGFESVFERQVEFNFAPED